MTDTNQNQNKKTSIEELKKLATLGFLRAQTQNQRDKNGNLKIWNDEPTRMADPTGDNLWVAEGSFNPNVPDNEFRIYDFVVFVQQRPDPLFFSFGPDGRFTLAINHNTRQLGYSRIEDKIQYIIPKQRVGQFAFIDVVNHDDELQIEGDIAREVFNALVAESRTSVDSSGALIDKK